MTDWVLKPYPLSETFFAERLRGCDYECSAEVFRRLRGVGIIDEEGFCTWRKCEDLNCW